MSMFAMCSQVVFSVAVAGLLLLPVGTWGQTLQGSEQAPTAPAGLTQAPAGKVEVTYTNGQLTIEANGTPLIDVLRAVCTQVGAELDAQAQPKDPISGTLGPGPVKDVVASLLNDAHVNYVLGSTAEDPKALASLAIFPQTRDSNPRYQVAGEQASQPQEDAPATPVNVQSAVNQMMELLEAAQAEYGGSVEVAALLQQIKAQIKAAPPGDDAADSPPAPISRAASNGVPVRRPLRRRR